MGNATNETTKKTNWLDAIKAQFKRIIWPTKEEAARCCPCCFRTAWSNYCCIRQSFTSADRRNYFIITEG